MFDTAGLIQMASHITQALLNWPLMIYVLCASIMCTIALGFIQIRYFAYAWKQVLFPPKQQSDQCADMTPFQAFINTLSTNLGNGSIAGMATAVHMGGPGAAIWVVIIGFILMSVRFAEVFLSVHFGMQQKERCSGIGGPMLYLRSVAGGRFLAPFYGLLCLIFMGIGSAVQSNSIRISMATTWNIPALATGLALLLFMVYVVYGGASRIVKVSDAIVPFKVGIFFVSAFALLAYHYAAIIPSLSLMIKAALSPQAFFGGVAGFTMIQAMRFGILRSILATESGLGTAAVLFSSTGSKEPVKDGIIAMLSTFISTLVCFLVALCIVASGVWDNGTTSTELTISAFSTLFGSFGGFVVSFLSIAFGVGVLVAYAYITREAWMSVTGGRLLALFPIVFCGVVFLGALVEAEQVFGLADIINGLMLFVNLYGIMYLMKIISKAVKEFRA